MRLFATFGVLRTTFCVCVTLGSVLASYQANATTITITRQDTPAAFPAYQYDSAGNLLGTIGPQGGANIIQDIAYDATTGDLWALIVNANISTGTTIANLTQNTSFLAGQSAFFDKGANIAVRNGFASITRQDTPAAFPAYQYDSAGNSLGTIGPQGGANIIQDITYDAATGDLWALIVNANISTGTTIANLTQNTSFLAGQSAFFDKGANIAVHNGFASITRQDLGIISGSLPAYQYDSAGNLLGTIGPQGDSNFIQDIAYDAVTGDLWALIVDARNSAGTTIANLTQSTSFPANQSVFFDKGANITVFSPSAVPEPTTLALMGLGLAGFGYQRRRRISS